MATSHALPQATALTPEETGRFLNAVARIPNARDRALCRLLLHAGLRVSELVALNTDHVRQADRAVCVPAGKTQARVVPVTDAATLADLAAVLDERGPASRTVCPLFATQSGERMLALTVAGIVRRTAQHAGLRAGPATLRLTYRATLIRAEATSDVVAQRMGHTPALT
jgi:site-specific recombinase XerD